MRKLCSLILLLLIALPQLGVAQEQKEVKVGTATILHGDFANLGMNILRTVETYRKHYLRHPLTFVYEDAGISSKDGLNAYRALIEGKHVQMLIGGTSSNGTMAGASLINSSKTVMITPVTGGSNVDHAGEYVFRIGNSDVLNGEDEAKLFISHSSGKVVLLTEETEYTQDIAKRFREVFPQLKGTIVYDETFAPGTTDFHSQLTRILASHPSGIFMPTQTGVPLALLLRQLHELGGFHGEIHTTFVAAENTDARKLAGDLFKGVYYMAPHYDKENPRLKEFIGKFKEDHQADPDIVFHTAGTVDALDMLQNYLDTTTSFSREGFQKYLLASIKDYKGLMGTYSFDQDGNANTGFEPARIE